MGQKLRWETTFMDWQSTGEAASRGASAGTLSASLSPRNCCHYSPSRWKINAALPPPLPPPGEEEVIMNPLAKESTFLLKLNYI